MTKLSMIAVKSVLLCHCEPERAWQSPGTIHQSAQQNLKLYREIPTSGESPPRNDSPHFEKHVILNVDAEKRHVTASDFHIGIKIMVGMFVSTII
jgi:hypothetical protein